MQQHASNALIQEEEQRLNRSEKKEIKPRYKFASPLYYQDDQKNEEFEQKINRSKSGGCSTKVQIYFTILLSR